MIIPLHPWSLARTDYIPETNCAHQPNMRRIWITFHFSVSLSQVPRPSIGLHVQNRGLKHKTFQSHFSVAGIWLTATLNDLSYRCDQSLYENTDKSPFFKHTSCFSIESRQRRHKVGTQFSRQRSLDKQNNRTRSLQVCFYDLNGVNLW